MAWADDFISIKLAVAQRSVVMRAYVPDRVEIAGQVEDYDLIRTNLQEYSLAVLDFVCSSNL